MTTRPAPFTVMHPKTVVYGRDERQLENMKRWCESLNFPVVFEAYEPTGTSCLAQLLTVTNRYQLLLFNSVKDLGSSILKAAEILLFLDDRRIQFRSFTETCIDSLSPYRQHTLEVIACLAGIEKSKLDHHRRRQKEGMALAIEQGKRIGRPQILNEKQVLKATSLHAEGQSFRRIGKSLRCSDVTVKTAIIRHSQQPST